MTHVYFIRHGIATDREEGQLDALRPLTPEGREKTHKVAQRLHSLGLRFDRLLSSPLVRACQTAEIISQTYDALPVESVDFLSPEGSFENWLHWLNLANPLSAVALVGHEPDLSSWTEIMVWGAVQGNIIIKKAGLVGLITPPTGPIGGNCTLFMLVPPKILLP